MYVGVLLGLVKTDPYLGYKFTRLDYLLKTKDNVLIHLTIIAV